MTEPPIQINLELIIDSSAYVTKTAQIQVKVLPTPNKIAGEHPDDDNNEDITTNDGDNDGPNTKNVQLTISHGNIFHPQAKLIIYVPRSSTKDYKLKIGEFNLFEEESECYLELQEEKIMEDGDEQEKAITKTLMGSYNQFSSRCKLHTHIIGNGNIFHPFCDLEFVNRDPSENKKRIMMIGNGNIFNSFVSMKQIICHDEIQNDDGFGASNESSYQNQVFFILSSSTVNYKESSASEKLVQRTNDNGVRKNMNDVTLLLSATKYILEKYHTLQSSSTTTAVYS